MLMKNRIIKLIYNDIFRPSRINIYQSLLKEAIDAGYSTCSHYEFLQLIKQDKVNPQTKYLLIRNDVDTDPRTAEMMFDVEKELGIKATYYFRHRTISRRIMDKISAGGSEVAYHYEEIATYAKKHKLKTVQEVDLHIEEIRKVFVENLKNFRLNYGLSSSSVASHGDFVNIYLKIPNKYLLNDKIRQECNIELEAYDTILNSILTCRIADLGDVDRIWTPLGMSTAIFNNEKILLVLVHPRQWHTRVCSNLKENYYRLIEGIKYKL